MWQTCKLVPKKNQSPSPSTAAILISPRHLSLCSRVKCSHKVVHPRFDLHNRSLTRKIVLATLSTSHNRHIYSYRPIPISLSLLIPRKNLPRISLPTFYPPPPPLLLLPRFAPQVKLLSSPSFPLLSYLAFSRSLFWKLSFSFFHTFLLSPSVISFSPFLI